MATCATDTKYDYCGAGSFEDITIYLVHTYHDLSLLICSHELNEQFLMELSSNFNVLIYPKMPICFYLQIILNMPVLQSFIKILMFSFSKIPQISDFQYLHFIKYPSNFNVLILQSVPQNVFLLQNAPAFIVCNVVASLVQR